ncbi:helicase associated protein [Frondihabitans sp. PhB188]|nr:helicase associated protein [Frondihabitans sp. PhB188]
MYRHLDTFVRERVHADAPRSCRMPSGEAVGAWLHRQRTLHRQGVLATEREEALTALGVTWRIASRRRDALAEIDVFSQHHGHVNVPADFVTSAGFALGTWVQSRRAQYARDSHHTVQLWPELDGIGFSWTAKPGPDVVWAQGLSALAAYRNDHGDSLVPAWWVSDGFPLGRWLDTRRTEYRAGRLDPDRVDALEQLDVLWRLKTVTDTVGREAREWAHFLLLASLLRQYQNSHGHTRMPIRYTTPDGTHLGRWLHRQRTQLREGRLSTERLRTLDTIDPDWNNTPHSH